MEQMEQSAEHAVLLGKDESSAPNSRWRMKVEVGLGVEVKMAVEAELKAPGGGW